MSESLRYQPPFSLSETSINRVASICENLGQRESRLHSEKGLRMRGIHKIRTIQGSLAIEGNTLTEGEIATILEGKAVVAPPREVQEVKNALKAYDRFGDWDPMSERDLLEAHETMMSGLSEEIGSYRSSGVGVVSRSDVVHMAPPASRIPALMADLFEWLGKTELHPLVSSSVFHYEFEFIHPFQDGNGRLGRLWQSLILAKWSPLFVQIPVESLVHENQGAYYAAIQASSNRADCGPFIDFMLEMIERALASTPQATPPS